MKRGLIWICCLTLVCILVGCGSQKKLENGEYSVEVTMTGGTGKASIESPCKLLVKDGSYYATIIWSSPYYDYMLVDGEEYEPTNEIGENSTFEIPVEALDEEITVTADTTAMSVPHEIDYTLKFDSSTIQ